MPTFASRFPAKLSPRVDFQPERFRKMIASHGLDVVWQAANECPCSRPSSGRGLSLDAAFGANTGTTQQGRVDCPSCGGSGYIYHDSQSIKGLITSPETHPDRFRSYGEMARGMICFTTLPEHRLNWGDKIVLRSASDVETDSAKTVHLYRETHTYRGEATSSTRYPIVSRVHDTDPAVTTGVTHVYTADANGLAQLDSAKIEGVDFTVNGSGQIVWINPPADDTRWSISYYSAPVYIITDLPHPYRDTKAKIKTPSQLHTSLPLKAFCTLEFLVTGRAT